MFKKMNFTKFRKSSLKVGGSIFAQCVVFILGGAFFSAWALEGGDYSTLPLIALFAVIFGAFLGYIVAAYREKFARADEVAEAWRPARREGLRAQAVAMETV